MSAAFFARRFSLEAPTTYFTLGASNDYTDSLGRFWKAAQGQWNYNANEQGFCPVPPGVNKVPAMADSVIYYTVVYYNPGDSYPITLPLASGDYTLKAHFWSFRHPAFNSSYAGLLDEYKTELIATHNVYDTAGGDNIAYTKDANRVITVGNHNLTLWLPVSSDGSYRLLSGIQVSRIGDASPQSEL